MPALSPEAEGHTVGRVIASGRRTLRGLRTGTCVERSNQARGRQRRSLAAASRIAESVSRARTQPSGQAAVTANSGQRSSGAAIG